MLSRFSASGGGGDAFLHLLARIAVEGVAFDHRSGDPFAPETKEHFGELSAFFDRHLAK